MKYRFTVLFYLFFLLVLGAVPAIAGLSKNLPAPVNQPVPEKLLQFIENKNQWDKSVRFKASVPGGQIYLQPQGFLFSFIDDSGIGHPEHTVTSGPVKTSKTTNISKAHAYSVTFLGAQKNALLAGKNASPALRNYYLGNDPKQWASGVKSFAEVNYQTLYPGIDMRLYEQSEHLKYEFLVQPQTNPAVIKMHYKGAENISIVNQELHIKTSVNKVIERQPYAYQYINNAKVEVPCFFVLEKEVVTFSFPQGYDNSLPLVIDPTLVFSTFSGSSADNWGFTATYDQAGDMYSGGIVATVGFPATIGAFDVSWNGTGIGSPATWDVGILKYKTSGAGSALLYATYLGGRFTEAPSSLLVNSKDELLILGSTSSDDFPTTAGAHDRVFNGGINLTPISGINYSQGSDIFISRLNATGSALLASTFLGGSNNDGVLGSAGQEFLLDKNYGDQFRGDIITDAADNIYIVSNTHSSNFPIVNGFQNSFGGGVLDAVVAKFNPALSLQWSSFLGGAGVDAAYSIQLDAGSNIFICGGTSSGNLPATNGAFKSTYVPPNTDGFVAKINNDGTAVQRLTYLGTGEYDQSYFVQLDEAGDVYILGQTLGAYPVSAGVFSVPNGRQFIHKLNNNLTATIFSTVFGSTLNDIRINISPTAFLVDNCSRIYVAGWGGGANAGAPQYTNGNTQGLPTTLDGFQRTTDGQDFYLMLLSRDAATLEYATFFGAVQNGTSGEHVDGGTSRFDKRGFVYQAVCGGCGGRSVFPTTPNAWSATNNSANCNNAAFKFDINIVTAVAGQNQEVCANAAGFQLTGFSPATGGTWSGQGVTPTGFFTPNPNFPATVALTYTVANGSCISTSIKTITINPVPVLSFTGLSPTYCLPAAPVTLVGSPVGGVFSGPGISGNTFNPVLAGNGTHTITYSFTSTAGCLVNTTQMVQVGTSPVVTAGPDQLICADKAPVALTGFSPANGTWSGTGVSATGLFTPSAAIVGTHVLTYTVTVGFCTVSQTKTVVVSPIPVISFTGLPAQVCIPAATIPLIGSPAGGIFSGPGISGNELNPTLAGAGTHTITYTFTTAAGCIVTSTKTIAIGISPVVDAGPLERICSGSFPLMLTGFSPAGGTWSGTGVSATGLFTPSAAIVGTHTLTYTVTTGFCTTSKTKTVIIDPTIVFTQGPAISLCPDGPLYTISQTDIAPLGGTWSGPGVSPAGVFNPAIAGPGKHTLTYYVTLGACSGISTKEITVSAFPIITAAAVPTECGTDKNIEGFAPFTASFTNNSTGASGYFWDFGDGTTSTEAIPTHVYTKDGNFKVTLTAFYGNGCNQKQNIAAVLVEKKQMVPNIFTPNNDGKNDTFIPRITCLPTDLKIFNRWGKLVYEHQNYENTWGGENLADGIYYYQLTSTKGQIWKGWVEIIR